MNTRAVMTPPSIYEPFQAPVIYADRLSWVDASGQNARFLFTADRLVFEDNGKSLPHLVCELVFPIAAILPAIHLTTSRTGILVGCRIAEALKMTNWIGHG